MDDSRDATLDSYLTQSKMNHKQDKQTKYLINLKNLSIILPILITERTGGMGIIQRIA